MVYRAEEYLKSAWRAINYMHLLFNWLKYIWSAIEEQVLHKFMVYCAEYYTYNAWTAIEECLDVLNNDQTW